jgi:hypothetical protein
MFDSEEKEKPAVELLEQTFRKIFAEKIRTDEEFCKELWSALANVEWYHPDTNTRDSYSFRAAGGLIAEIRESGDYMDWYCSGPYSTVSEFIRRSMKKEGWIYDDTAAICDEPGCLKDMSCGFPDGDTYRRTCHEHSKGKFS